MVVWDQRVRLKVSGCVGSESEADLLYYLYQVLALSVQGTGGIIKNQDLRLSNQSSCNGDSLLLTT